MGKGGHFWNNLKQLGTFLSPLSEQVTETSTYQSPGKPLHFDLNKCWTSITFLHLKCRALSRLLRASSWWWGRKRQQPLQNNFIVWTLLQEVGNMGFKPFLDWRGLNCNSFFLRVYPTHQAREVLHSAHCVRLWSTKRIGKRELDFSAHWWGQAWESPESWSQLSLLFKYSLLLICNTGTHSVK